MGLVDYIDHVAARTPSVTTIAQAWRTARAAEPEFSAVRWNRHVEVETTTR
jgi:hypothetical protein